MSVKDHSLMRHLSEAIRYAEETGRRDLARMLIAEMHALAKRLAERRC